MCRRTQSLGSSAKTGCASYAGRDVSSPYRRDCVLPTCGSLDAVHVGHRAQTGTYVPARNLEGAMTTLSFARPHRLAPWLWLCIATLITLALGAAWLPGQSWAAVSAQSWS